MSLPTDAQSRKNFPITTGVLDYFPDAVAAVAEVSRLGNEQHNPGQPLHWAREKSTDHPDCIARHLIERGTRDVDGSRHSAKLAWRALALLQTEIEAERLTVSAPKEEETVRQGDGQGSVQERARKYAMPPVNVPYRDPGPLSIVPQRVAKDPREKYRA